MRPVNKIAADVIELLRGDVDDKKTLVGIVRQLEAVRHIYQNGMPKAGAIREDAAKERRRLQRLGRKWLRISLVAACYSRADQWLSVLENTHGPSSRYRWFDDVCAIMAQDMILRSRDQTLGDRLRTLAGYLYEAATGIPDRKLETACRRVGKAPLPGLRTGL
jgi:hypothetical protein